MSHSSGVDFGLRYKLSTRNFNESFFQGRNKHGLFLLAIHLDFSVIFNISCYLNIILTWETFYFAGEPWQTGMYYFVCYDVFSFTRNMFSPIIMFHQTLCSHEAFRQNRARIIHTITL